MEVKTTNSEPDLLLAEFAGEPDEGRAASILSVLMTEHIMPVVESIIATAAVGRTLETGLDREDVKGDVAVKLLARLKEYRAKPAKEPFESLIGYAAVTTYNACHSYLRSKYPERSRLKNSIRYVLKHKAGFAIWESEGRASLCGLESWRGNKAAPFPPGKLAGLTGCIETRGDPAGGNQQPRNPVPLLVEVFELAGAPLEFDDLVTLVAKVWGIEDQKRVDAAPREGCDIYDWLASDAPRQDEMIESRLKVSLLWREICELPRRQAMALLLALKDGNGVDGVSLLENAQVASVSEIAEALGLEASRLAGMWDELPMGDIAIGRYMGITAQQVANLRKMARRRLALRMRTYRENKSGELIDIRAGIRSIKARREQGVGGE